MPLLPGRIERMGDQRPAVAAVLVRRIDDQRTEQQAGRFADLDRCQPHRGDQSVAAKSGKGEIGIVRRLFAHAKGGAGQRTGSEGGRQQGVDDGKVFRLFRPDLQSQAHDGIRAEIGRAANRTTAGREASNAR